MFGFTCPKCQRTATAEANQSGQVVPCFGCHQRLRVVIEEPNSNGSPLAGGDGLPSAKAAAQTRRGPSGLAIASSGLAGLGVAALLVLVWFFLGRGPATSPGDSAIAQTPDKDQDPPREVDRAKDRPAQVVKPQDKSPVKPQDKPQDKPLDKPQDKPLDKPQDKPLDKPQDKPKDKPLDKPQDKKPENPKEKDPPPVIRVSLAPEEISQRLYRSTALIYAASRNSEGKLDAGLGTGSIVDVAERLVLTNEHVANRKSEVVRVLFPAFKNKALITNWEHYSSELTARNGRAITAKVVHVDAGRDLALLQLESLPEDVAAVKISPSGANPGQALHTVGGKPKGTTGMWSYAPGNVRQVSRQRWSYGDGIVREADIIESTIPTNSGNSGGPIVDSRCMLVGVHCQAPSDLSIRGVAGHVHVPEVLDFLAAYFKRIGKPWTPPVEEQDLAIRDSLQKSVTALSSPDPDARQKAIRTLGELGRSAKEAVVPLLKIARDSREKEEIRKEAQTALPQIGAPGKDQLPALADALHDERVTVRVYAADALGGASDIEAKMAAELVQACKDAEPAVRASAALALGKIGAKVRAEAAAELQRLLDDKDDLVRRAAYGSVVRIAHLTPADADTLKAMLAGRTGFAEKRMFAALALSSLGAEFVPVIAQAMLTEDDSRVLQILCLALGDLKPRTKEVGKGLARLVAHAEPLVRQAAAGLLVQLLRTGLDRSILSPILKALSSEDEAIRKALFDNMPLLSVYAKNPPEVAVTLDELEDLKAAASSRAPAARLTAAYLLGTLGPDAAPAVPALQRALDKALEKEKPELVQLEALHALGRIGPKAKDALPLVHRLMTDNDAKNRQLHLEAALAFLQIEPKDEPLRLDAYKALALALDWGDDDEVSPMFKQVFVRCKSELESGGKNAALALVHVFNLRFYGPANGMKFKARERTCNILEKIGQKAYHPNVKSTLVREMQSIDTPETIQAARAAHDAIFKKK